MSNNLAGGGNILHVPFRPTLLSRILLAVKNWRTRRLAARELRALPDALLRDIGIERYQIEEVVKGGGAQVATLPTTLYGAKPVAAVKTAVKKAA